MISLVIRRILRVLYWMDANKWMTKSTSLPGRDTQWDYINNQQWAQTGKNSLNRVPRTLVIKDGGLLALEIVTNKLG